MWSNLYRIVITLGRLHRLPGVQRSCGVRAPDHGLLIRAADFGEVEGPGAAVMQGAVRVLGFPTDGGYSVRVACRSVLAWRQIRLVSLAPMNAAAALAMLRLLGGFQISQA